MIYFGKIIIPWGGRVKVGIVRDGSEWQIIKDLDNPTLILWTSVAANLCKQQMLNATDLDCWS